MMADPKAGLLVIVKQSFKDFMKDDCMTSAAALSYYTVFSLPAILMLIMLLVSSVMDPTDVRGGLESQMEALMGPSAGGEVRTILQQTERPGGGLIPTIVGIVALVFGATGALGQLQAALNRAWNVEPDPRQGGIKNFLTKRLFSLGMLLSIAFMLLVSLVISAGLSALSEHVNAYLPFGHFILQAVNFLISFALISVLFAAIYKVLPDKDLEWRDVLVGAVVTAFLFSIGKFLIGLYIGSSAVASSYGAAGALIVALLWIYYSTQIFLLGAEFAKVYAHHHGSQQLEPQAADMNERQAPF